MCLVDDASALTAAEAVELPLGRLLTRDQVLRHLDMTDTVLDTALAAGRIVAVQLAGRPEQYPQAQFTAPNCLGQQVAATRAAFAPIDPSGALAACWLNRTTDRLDLTWRGTSVSVTDSGRWPLITVQAG